MTTSTLAFSMTFAPGGAVFSPTELNARFESMRAELGRLLPILDHLTFSTWTDRVGIGADGNYKYFVYLCLNEQRDIFAGDEAPDELLRLDVAVIRKHLADLQDQVFWDYVQPQGEYDATGKARAKSRQVLRAFQGKTFVFEFPDGTAQVEFPTLPEYVFDPTERTITGYVSDIRAEEIKFRGIRYLDGQQSPALGTKRERWVRIPPFSRTTNGLLCAVGQRTSKPIQMVVGTYLDVVDGSVLCFEVKSIINTSELLDAFDVWRRTITP